MSERGLHNEDGLVRAVELVLTPLLFAAGGFGLDALAGTRPVFTLLLGGTAFVAKVLVEWYRYNARMARHEAEMASSRTSARRELRNEDAPLAAELAAADGLPAGVTLQPGNES